MYGYTYLITNLVNGHQYVGQHQYDKPELDPNYFGSGELLKKKIEEYGKENFSIELLQLCDNQIELNDAEIRGIAKYKTFVDWGYGGYNLTTGGEGYTVSEVTKEKIGKSHIGLKATDETKRKMSDAKKGKQISDETKAKMSEIKKGKKPYEMTDEIRKNISKGHKGQVSWLKGGHCSEEHKRKISEANKGHVAWNKGIPQSEEAKRKMSESRKGKITWMKGKKHTKEAKEKNRIAHLGKKLEKYNWQTPNGDIKSMAMAHAKRFHPDWKLIE